MKNRYPGKSERPENKAQHLEAFFLSHAIFMSEITEHLLNGRFRGTRTSMKGLRDKIVKQQDIIDRQKTKIKVLERRVADQTAELRKLQPKRKLKKD
ncbi:unnamed protein product [Cyprideis torosa]|uniref:Uncharacterized protein n=1 Tax=Cyprideis torosa TaxID=163714 RepID=A0A7R8WL06_9CRUS|nr:unnamed protein product [Cyprideis torosa]CAG0897484.1 unnamed protein product [Cyprideis torosa]